MAGLSSEIQSGGVFGNESSTYSCRSESTEGGENASPLCPQCISKKVWRDGIRYISGGEVQRWLCRDCGLRFSISSNQSRAVETVETVQTKELKSKGAKGITCKICAKGAKNLHVPTSKRIGTGEVTDETKAAITVFQGWLQKQGYKKNAYPNNLLTLVHLGADLKDPEDVKAKIGAHNVKDGMKMMFCYSYEAFLTMNKLTWDRPHYKQEEIIPFIPEEGELDQLIAAAHSERMGTYLQTLKETFTDPGEALAIEWKDIAGNVININHPVKDHRPRTLEVSKRLIAMINMLPHKSERVFDCSYSVACSTFVRLRKRIAVRTKNDRINYIEMRSFRHWGGTMIAEISNGNVLTVMKLLGHRRVENSMKYINIYKLRFRSETEYEYLAVTTPEELKVALLGGYQLVIEKFGASWFRRPKRIAIAGTPINQRSEENQGQPIETSFNNRKEDLINLF